MTLHHILEEIFNRRVWAEDADALILKVASRELGDPFPVLAAYLSHSNINFQSHAFEIMMRLEPERSMDYAVSLLHDTSWHFDVCHLIARCGGTNQVQSQVVDILLHSPSVGTRYMAARALGRIGNRDAIAALQHAQQHDHELDSGGWSVSSAAKEAIEIIQESSDE